MILDPMRDVAQNQYATLAGAQLGQLGKIEGPAKEPGVSSQIETLISRLTGVAGSLEETADAIFGPTTTALNQVGTASPSTMDIHSRLRDLTRLVERIDTATNRISSGL